LAFGHTNDFGFTATEPFSIFPRKSILLKDSLLGKHEFISEFTFEKKIQRK